MDVVATDFDHWLSTQQHHDGIAYLSEARRFAHDETDYDHQYDNDPLNLNVGRGVVNVVRSVNGDFSGPALEFGCGTGLVSLGLVAEGAYETCLITDPSPVFLNIVQRKMARAGIDPASMALAVLDGEHLHLLPSEAFSLLVMRSTLHHVLDVDEFLRQAARTLRPGGVFTCQEPCMEGYVLMGALGQFIPMVLDQSRDRLTRAHRKQCQNFVDTMKFYARRDIDKAHAEDKHLFRVEELIQTGRDYGLRVEFSKNLTYDNYAATPHPEVEPAPFSEFFRNYLKYCMSFDETLVGLFEKHFKAYCAFVDDISHGGEGPAMHGVFVCTKE